MSAADRHEVVAGWTLDDVGSKPGDDSDRNVTMRKSIPEVDLTYAAGQGADGGSIQMKFKRCLGLSYGSGFGFDDPPSPTTPPRLAARSPTPSPTSPATARPRTRARRG